MDDMQESNIILKKILTSSYNNYIDSNVTISNKKNGCVYYGGRSAILFLSNILKKNFDMQKKVYNPDTQKYSNFNQAKELFNGITGILNRRKILIECLNVFEDYFKLKEFVLADINKWNFYKSILIRNYYRAPDEKVNIDINHLVKAEEKMFSSLTKFIFL